MTNYNVFLLGDLMAECPLSQSTAEEILYWKSCTVFLTCFLFFFIIFNEVQDYKSHDFCINVFEFAKDLQKNIFLSFALLAEPVRNNPYYACNKVASEKQCMKSYEKL